MNDVHETSEAPSARYAVLGGRIANACMAMEMFRKDGTPSKVFDHAVGVSEAIKFLESAGAGLYSMINAQELDDAYFIMDEVRPDIDSGGLDILLTKSGTALEQMRDGKTPDPTDFSNAKALLYDLACKMTGLPSIYPGMVTRD